MAGAALRNGCHGPSNIALEPSALVNFVSAAAQR